MAMALFSSPHLQNLSSFSAKPTSLSKLSLLLHSKRPISLILPKASDNGGQMVGSTSTATTTTTTTNSTVIDKKVGTDAAEKEAESAIEEVETSLGLNGSASASPAPLKFQDPKWVNGTWDLKQFSKNGETDWDAVIDAEARRRKWMEDNPESSSNDDPVLFDSSIIPWWVWVRRYHLPEAELLNGRAAMIGFFMAYFVDSLTGVGLVDQMGNFFCKTLLLVAVVGVLMIRKNEDVENLKKLLEETTLYDKQWQAAWQDDNNNPPKKD